MAVQSLQLAQSLGPLLPVDLEWLIMNLGHIEVGQILGYKSICPTPIFKNFQTNKLLVSTFIYIQIQYTCTFNIAGDLEDLNVSL